MKRSIVLTVCLAGCGFVLNVRALEKRVVAEHDGAGIDQLLVRLSLSQDVIIRGGADTYAAQMTTIEWRNPEDEDAPARSAIAFEQSASELEVVLSGGDESVTLHAVELDVPRQPGLVAHVQAAELRVSDIDGPASLYNSGPIYATAMSGATDIGGPGLVVAEVAGPVDIDGKTVRARLAGEGRIHASFALEVELLGALSGPLDLQCDGESEVLITVEPGNGITLELRSVLGTIDVVVGDTNIAISGESSTQVIEIGGGGPRLSLVAQGPIRVVDPSLVVPDG